LAKIAADKIFTLYTEEKKNISGNKVVIQKQKDEQHFSVQI
jgi:hypothetical protein